MPLAYLLLESGGRLLLEGGGALELESSSAANVVGEMTFALAQSSTLALSLSQPAMAAFALSHPATISYTITGEGDAMNDFTRGNVLQISASPSSAASPPVAPTAAKAVLVFYASGVETTATVVLSLTGGAWIGDWDSSPADPGLVQLTVSCSGPLVARVDGSFNLTAGSANGL